MIRLPRLLGALSLITALMSGCTGASSVSSDNPMSDLQNRELADEVRSGAVNRVWADAPPGSPDRTLALKTFRDLAWSFDTPVPVRQEIVTTLVRDPDPQVAADGREMVRLMIPKERSRAMEAFLCKTAADNGWTECAAALVRSYSRIVPGVPDDQRGERVALSQLFPGKPVETVVFETFMNPPEEKAMGDLDMRERTRMDAWELLGRLDTDGSIRMTLMSTTGAGSADSKIVADIRACYTDLKALPISSDELKWLQKLRDGSEPNEAWWREATAAIARLSVEQQRGMALRHAEPVRVAAAKYPAWLAMSREEVLSEFRTRLDGRHHRRRTDDATTTTNPREHRLEVWQDKLRYVDVLTMLVIDEATRDAAVAPTFFRQAQTDQRDESTEYGGVIEFNEKGFRTRLYPPRPGQRVGDEQFIASDAMIDGSPRSLAHYHFHVQKTLNDRFAGPSRGDYQYAAKSGRTCLVITSVAVDTLNIDLYQPNGVLIDMGDLAGNSGE